MTKFRFTRRDLLNAAKISGVAAVTTATGLIGHKSSLSRTVSGVCRICTMHCNLAGIVENGRLARVDGKLRSSTRGFLCAHGHALPEIVHSADRIKRPLKRSESGFIEISWDQALGEIAERLKSIKAEYGARSLAVHTGWPFVRHPLIPFLHRFCLAFGTPNLSTVASLCEAALRMGKALTVGSNFFPDLHKTRTLCVWGINPTYSLPPLAHFVGGKAFSGNNLIVIDPYRTELAQKAALHLQIIPGTDGALALGMINQLVKEKLFDKEMVDNCTVGFDRLLPVLEKYTLENVERITSVPKEKIARAVELMAKETPSAILNGLGIEHHENSLQTIRAVTIFEALCGTLDKPGGGQLANKPGPRFFLEPLPSLYRMTTPSPAPPDSEIKPIGYDEYPLFEIFNRQAQGNLYPRAILEDKPYPLRALIFIGCNAMVTWPDSTRLKKALEKLPLLISVDPFLNATGELAHYILPAATFAESAVPTKEIEARSSMVPEQHESWPDWKIVFELAKALGMNDYFPWKTFGEALAAPRVTFMKDELHTPKPFPPPEGRSTQESDAKAAGSQAPRFPTRSGKIEIYSRLMEEFGANPLPEYVPSAGQPNSEYPYILVTGPRNRQFINSQMRNVQSIVSKQRKPYALINPATAREAGIKDGEQVVVVSAGGRLQLGVRVDECVHPRVIVLPFGWARQNANLLTNGESLDPVTGFPNFRSIAGRIERVTIRERHD